MHEVNTENVESQQEGKESILVFVNTEMYAACHNTVSANG